MSVDNTYKGKKNCHFSEEIWAFPTLHQGCSVCRVGLLFLCVWYNKEVFFQGNIWTQ
jgi:hypothetical protein